MSQKVIEISESLIDLCALYFPHDEASATKHVRHTLSIISNPIFVCDSVDELKIVSKIQRRLSKANRTSVAVKFGQLCQQLQSKGRISKRSELLLFLCALSKQESSIESLKGLRINSQMIRMNHINGETRCNKRPTSIPTADIASTSSGVSTSRSGSGRSVTRTSEERIASRKDVLSGRNAHDQDANRVAEDDLLRDILFCLQGIDGRYIKLDEKNCKFAINEIDNISMPIRKILIRIADCGLLYSNIKKLLDRMSLNQKRGSISTAFTAAIQSELTEYYRSLAIYQSQIDFQRSCVQHSDDDLTRGDARISLSRVIPLLMRWRDKLILILSVLECCKDLVGGKIASSLFTYSNTGDFEMGSLVAGLLESTCRPILVYSCLWMFDGKLEDPSCEFFVAKKDDVVGENAWREKFSVREAMLPSFIDLPLAKKILLAGKSINFLRLICNERISILPQLEPRRMALLNLPVTCLFDYVQKEKLVDIVDNVYQEISKYLIEVLNNEFHMFSHLSALKKYILLSQGDFCRCLLDLLEYVHEKILCTYALKIREVFCDFSTSDFVMNDLEKPANQVFRHVVITNLDASLRQTNARFECKEILDRIKVDFTDFTDDDTGWDVFRLKYLNGGVLSMILNQKCLASYNRLFDFIWRLKRVSFVLSNIWRDNIILRKSDCVLNENAGLLHSFQLMTAEMAHFTEQMLYYVLFEVLECSWEKLVVDNTKSKDLDDIINAHDDYLHTLLNESLLNVDQMALLNKYRILLDLIFEFAALHKKFVDQLFEFSNDRKTVNMRMSSSEITEFQLKVVVKAAQISRTFKPNLANLLEQYRNCLREFLISLTTQDRENWRLLSFRLDFSQFYRSSYGPALDESLTFSGRRRSKTKKGERLEILQ